MISYKQKILNIFNEYKFYLIFLIIFSPVFISLDLSNGLKFDACLAHLYAKPSIPVSFLLLGFFSLVQLNQLLINKQLIILILFIVLYMMLNLYYGTTRALIVGLGMVSPLLSFYTFKNYFNKTNNMYKIMYLTLFTMIILKFISDFYRIYIDHSAIEVNISNAFEDALNMKFNTSYYFINPIRIYNYYDYFSFIYYVAVSLSFYNIINHIMIKRSVLLIIISLLVVLSTGSRLFIYGIYLVPILYVFYKISRLKLEQYFYLFMSLSIFITLLIGLVDFNLNDISLATRNNLALMYFSDFSSINIVMPFINQHRLETLGSFHNELLEIFSFFGPIIIYYYYLVMKIYSDIQEKYKLIGFFLIFIIIIGSLIQINISNPYIGIMLGMILAVLSLDNQDVKQENATE